MLTLPKARVYGARSTTDGDQRVGEPLHVDPSGRHMVFCYPDGAIHRVKRVFGSRLAQRWMRGELDACEAFVQAQLEDGANSLRVFCQFHRGIALSDADIFHPADSSPDRWRAFSRWLLARGLRWEPTILADCEAFGMNHVAQVARVRMVVEALAGEPNATPEISNEWFKNSDDPGGIARELGYDRSRPLLMSTGDYSCSPGMVVLDWVGDHAERKPDHAGEAAKMGHFVNEGWAPDANSPHGWRGSNGPVLEDETVGLAEKPAGWYGNRDSRPEAIEDAYAGFAVGGAGATVFSDAHHQADVPGPIVRALTRVAFQAMDAVPLEMPTGAYVHEDFPDHPLEKCHGTADEVAGRVLGNRAYIVAANPRGFVAVPRNGWRIVRQNTRGNILELVR